MMGPFSDVVIRLAKAHMEGDESVTGPLYDAVAESVPELADLLHRHLFGNVNRSPCSAGDCAVVEYISCNYTLDLFDGWYGIL